MPNKALQPALVVLAVAGIALVGQAIGRQVTLRLDDGEALRAAGFARRQRALVVLPRSVVLAVAGAALALVVAVAASPLAPVGLARRAELHPGVAIDGPVLALGAAMVVGNVLALIRPPESGEQPPIGRAAAMIVLGAVAAIWGIASLVA